MTAQRIEQIINGQTYEIEILPVKPDRWRAYLVRAAGPTARLMPFYGHTPEEAARHLVDWLSLAHRVASNSA